MTERDVRPADLLAAYELGLLDDRQRARLEQALRDDTDLLEELYDAAPLATALRRDPDGYARVLDAAAPVTTRSGAGGWLRHLLAVRPALAAVTTAAILVVTFLSLRPGGGDLRGLADLTPLPYTALAVRAGTGPADSLFTVAMADYGAGRYAQAAAGLAGALAVADSTWSRRDQARLYRGVALLESGRTVAARHELATAAQASLRPVAEKARWYLVQADLLLADASAARRDLAPLRQSPVYGVQARSLLEELAQR